MILTGEVRGWDTHTGRLTLSFTSGGYYGELTVLDLTRAKVEHTIHHPGGISSVATALTVSKSREVVLTAESGSPMPPLDRKTWSWSTRGRLPR
jgi:hypothetical protein